MQTAVFGFAQCQIVSAVGGQIGGLGVERGGLGGYQFHFAFPLLNNLLLQQYYIIVRELCQQKETEAGLFAYLCFVAVVSSVVSGVVFADESIAPPPHSSGFIATYCKPLGSLKFTGLFAQ